MRSLISAAVFAAGLVIAAGSASAQDASSAPQLACTAAGLSYKVGEIACVPACHEARRLARCDGGTDGASWTYISDACPTASLSAQFSAIVNASYPVQQ